MGFNRVGPSRVPRKAQPKTRSVPPSQSSVFGGLGRADAPLTGARDQADRSARRAEAALPKRPTPAIPTIRNPSRAQAKAGVDAATRAQQRAVSTSKPGAERTGAQDAYYRELQNDPRQANYLKAVRLYEKALAKGELEDLGRRAVDYEQPGAGGKVTRQQAIRAGAEVAKRRRARDGEVRPHAQDTKLSAAGLNLNLTSVGRTLSNATSLGAASPENQFFKNAGSDVVNFPKNAVLSGYEAGAATVDLAHGKTARAKRLLKGLSEGVLGNLAQGDWAGAEEAFREHPVYSALEVSGAGAAVGRGAGLAARLARGTRSLSREPLEVIPGANLRVQRRGSPNAIVQALQRGTDAQRAARMGGQVAESSGRGRLGGAVRGEAVTGREALINDAVDEFSSQREGLRRAGRGETGRAARGMAPTRRGDARGGVLKRMVAAVDRGSADARRQAGLGTRVEQDLVSLAAEGRLTDPARFRGDPVARQRAMVTDLHRERDRLQKVYVTERRDMSPVKREANRRQVRMIDRALKDPGALAKVADIMRAADAYKGKSDQLEAALIKRTALDPEQARESKLRTYAVAVMNAKPSTKTEGLLDSAGNPLRAKDIEAHIRENGHREPAFLGHTMEPSSRAYFVNWISGRKTVDKKRRTGESARTGAHTTGYQGLVDDLVRRQGQTDAIDAWDDFVGEFVAKGADGKPMTPREAEHEMARYQDAHGTEMQMVRLVPARYDGEAQRAILEGQGSGSLPDLAGLTIARAHEALRTPDDKGARNVGIIPRQAVQRFMDHQLTVARGPGKVGQVMTSIFRGAVLPFSTKWLFGNVAEATLRMALNGITPVDIVRGHRLMKTLRSQDEKMWREMDVRTRGGLLYGSTDRLSVHRGAEDFAMTSLEGPAKAVAAFTQLPVIRQAALGLRGYQNAVFTINRAIERGAQTGVIGKAARRDVLDMTGSWTKALRMQKDVMEEVSKGLLGTSKQVQYARYVYEVLGKYSRFSPSTRRVIQTFAPFLPWFLNSARLVYYTLPVKHPIKTALITNVERTFADEWSQRDVPPGSLEAAISVGGGGLLDLSRYTPFGAFTNLPEGLADPLLPQLSSVVPILKGQSWTGDKIRLEDGSTPSKGKLVVMAIYAGLESSFPGIAIGRRLQEGGGTGYDDSTIVSPKTKPGTAHGDAGFVAALNRVLNPLRPTYLNPGSGSSVSTAGPAEGSKPSILERAAERQAQQGGYSDKQLKMLERAAARASGG